MNNQYHESIVITQTGAVDLEHYQSEAARLRSEYLLSLFKSAAISIKGLFITLKDISDETTNTIQAAKLAR